jgi:hypothetical protein
MWIDGTCSTVQVGKYWSDLFPIRSGLKQGDASRKVQANHEIMESSGTHHILAVYFTIKINTECLVVAGN